jgi:hypothetical protein
MNLINFSYFYFRCCEGKLNETLYGFCLLFSIDFPALLFLNFVREIECNFWNFSWTFSLNFEMEFFLHFFDDVMGNWMKILGGFLYRNFLFFNGKFNETFYYILDVFFYVFLNEYFDVFSIKFLVNFLMHFLMYFSIKFSSIFLNRNFAIFFIHFPLIFRALLFWILCEKFVWIF